MIHASYLKENFILNAPATKEALEQAQSVIAMNLPAEYKGLMLVSNGLHTSGNLAIHEIEDMPARNAEYEVSEFLPGYFMIGDDGGGRAILMNEDGEVFEVGMGSMSEVDLEKSADSIEDLLVKHQGQTLNERG